MWYMIAAIATGFGGPCYASKPCHTNTQFYMERGLTSEESCKRMAARYKAFEKFNISGRLVSVDVECLPVDVPPIGGR